MNGHKKPPRPSRSKSPAARAASEQTRAGELSAFSGLLDTLNLLVAQTRAYERALPADNYPARAAVATLANLARQAPVSYTHLTLPTN